MQQFVKPYIGKAGKYKRRTIRSRGQSGIYIIREDEVIVYVGMSVSCVTEALYRHFYIYNDSHQQSRHFYSLDTLLNYDVFILVCTKDEAPKLERGLILSLEPRDNVDRFKKYLQQLQEPVKAVSVIEEVIIEDMPF